MNKDNIEIRDINSKNIWVLSSFEEMKIGDIIVDQNLKPILNIISIDEKFIIKNNIRVGIIFDGNMVFKLK